MHQNVRKRSQQNQGSHGGHLPQTQGRLSRNFDHPTAGPSSFRDNGAFSILGIVLLFTFWASILFDTGTSYSFISLVFASNLGLKIEFLDADLFVSTSIGGIVLLYQVCRSFLLSIAKQ